MISRFLVLFYLQFILVFSESYCQVAGNSIILNGSTDYIQVNYNTSIDIPNNTTMEAWVNSCRRDGYREILNRNICNGIDGGYHFGIRDGKLEFIWTETTSCNSVNGYHSDKIVLNLIPGHMLLSSITAHPLPL